MKGITKTAMVAALAGIVLFALGGTALATTGQNGPVPPKVGDPVGTNVSPHGGYSATTNYCLQCHGVHDGGEYALMSTSSVTDTCATCHSLFGNSTSGPVAPGIPGTTPATASSRSAYDNDPAASGHAIGSLSIPFSTVGTITESGWSYHGTPATWNSSTAAGPGTADGSGGLYCGDCHTPHGDFGYMVNSPASGFRTTANGASLNTVQPFVEGAAFYVSVAGTPTVKYLHLDTDPAGQWEACNAGVVSANPGGVDNVGGVNCTYLTTTDSEGQLVSLYGYKLLSAYPNHSWSQGPESWNMDTRGHDIARWCGRCHNKALDVMWGGTFHAHPTGCTACHGNPTSDPTSKDFPHTSTFAGLLKAYPDALCISCHTAGSLP